MVGKPVVTETDNSKVTRQDLYYEIIPSEIPEQWHVRLHWQEWGYYEYKQGWLFKTTIQRYFHKDHIQKFYRKDDYEYHREELMFPNTPEARRYIEHLQKKSERVWIDA